MSAEVLDGKRIAKEIQAEIKQRVATFVETHHFAPALAAVLVGDDPASQVYVRNKERACERAGIKSQLHRMPADSTTDEVLEKVRQLNEDPEVSGILVQLPLPREVDTQVVLDAVSPLKDVDAFHPRNVGLISQGRPQFLPCTPHGIIQMLKRYQIHTQGKNVVIVGRSDIVGKPMALMLANRDIGLGPEMANATVTICHSQTSDLGAVTQQADILIAAIGQPKFITGDMVKLGAVVVDVGINRTDDGLVGDVDYNDVVPVASYVTPVPGGVGPLTVTMLLENTLSAAGLQLAAVGS
ncbi:MAG: bifunctional methylenetetrahydrofolate dehydrogenase/methenyltetrahydrofolate cyclohydrolase FolD [Mariniblastus sp.]|nr:bifunctional methylenetetrahydrofolate dehydrogenase/methenyltetrahydrofolate cyclohydrolase FolD [Mariniblastus sp.]